MEKITSAMYEKFQKTELKFLNDCKYFEGINTHKDPGEEFVTEWIQANAQMFRDKWNESLCKECEYCESCGHLLKIQCDRFMEEE